MAGMLETPSRIWRRIEAVQDREMPSLPSLPSFDESEDEEEAATSRVIPEESEEDDDDFNSLANISTPITSTPAPNHSHTAALHSHLSTASTVKFAYSIASRSNKSSIGPVTKSKKDSFDITDIPSLSAIPRDGATFDKDFEDDISRDVGPRIYSPSRSEEMPNEYSISEALQSVSRSNSPPHTLSAKAGTPKRNFDYEESLKSDSKVCILLRHWASLIVLDRLRHLTSTRTWQCAEI